MSDRIEIGILSQDYDFDPIGHSEMQPWQVYKLFVPMRTGGHPIFTYQRFIFHP